MNTQPHLQSIRSYLSHCRELGRLCRQNGWIDNDTLHFQIERSGTAEALVAVSFEEVIMEGAGCTADRRQRFGKLRFRFGPDGEVQSAEEA